MPRLTDQQKEIVKDRYLAGETIEQLSLDLHRDPKTIANALHARDVSMRKPGERGLERKADPKIEAEGKLGINDPGARIARPSVARMMR